MKLAYSRAISVLRGNEPIKFCVPPAARWQSDLRMGARARARARAIALARIHLKCAPIQSRCVYDRQRVTAPMAQASTSRLERPTAPCGQPSASSPCPSLDGPGPLSQVTPCPAGRRKAPPWDGLGRRKVMRRTRRPTARRLFQSIEDLIEAKRSCRLAASARASSSSARARRSSASLEARACHRAFRLVCW